MLTPKSSFYSGKSSQCDILTNTNKLTEEIQFSKNKPKST